GIRYFHVTGVQTCALPIFMPTGELELRVAARIGGVEQTVVANPPGTQGTYTGGTVCHLRWRMIGPHVWGKVWTDANPEPAGWQRSEERRVGKEETQGGATR